MIGVDDFEGRDESFDAMNLKEFLEKYADLTAEQLEEVDTLFKNHGIQDFDALRPFDTEDLIHHLDMSKETAKKIHLATMKNTCLLFAELVEIGGLPLMQSGP
jgi:urate oxidase